MKNSNENDAQPICQFGVGHHPTQNPASAPGCAEDFKIHGALTSSPREAR